MVAGLGGYGLQVVSGLGLALLVAEGGEVFVQAVSGRRLEEKEKARELSGGDLSGDRALGFRVVQGEGRMQEL